MLSMRGYTRSPKILFFRFCKAIGLFHLSRWLMRRRLLILGFHGIALDDEASFRPKLFMEEQRFRQRLETLHRHRFPVYTLAEALDGLDRGTLAPNPVVITIDDGFYDTLSRTAPALQEYDFPATLYLTTYYVAHPGPIFRLAIQYLFWKTRQNRLHLRDVSWLPATAIDLQDPGQSEKAMWQIIKHGEQHCDEAGRKAICRRLAEALNVDYEALVETRILSLLTPEELPKLQTLGIDLQLHTHRHRLPPGDTDQCRREISDNRVFLHGVLKQWKTHLCYPSGEWDQRLWDCLEKAGIESAVTCEPGMNTPKTPRLALRRILDQNDLSQIEFEAELYGFCELMRVLSGKG